MGTPNPKKASTPKLTPEQAAELNRRQAARRQADKRERDRQQAADEAAMLAEAEAQAAAEEKARVAHLADVEKRLAEAEKTISMTQERLDDAVLLLACHHDVDHWRRRGARKDLVDGHYRLVAQSFVRFRDTARATWQCDQAGPGPRIRSLLQDITVGIGNLPSVDEPASTTRNVTGVGTPVTATVRNADRPERIADRSYEAPPISDEEQAWIDAQSRDPYDPYEAHVAHIEALAEGGVEDDHDDGERF